MGGIDLDPASCDAANEVVKADKFYTQADNGLVQPWSGRVFCNPTFGGGLMASFARRGLAEYSTGRIDQMCLLVWNSTSSAWFQEVARAADSALFRISPNIVLAVGS